MKIKIGFVYAIFLSISTNLYSQKIDSVFVSSFFNSLPIEVFYWKSLSDFEVFKVNSGIEEIYVLNEKNSLVFDKAKSKMFILSYYVLSINDTGKIDFTHPSFETIEVKSNEKPLAANDNEYFTTVNRINEFSNLLSDYEECRRKYEEPISGLESSILLQIFNLSLAYELINLGRELNKNSEYALKVTKKDHIIATSIIFADLAYFFIKEKIIKNRMMKKMKIYERQLFDLQPLYNKN